MAARGDASDRAKGLSGRGVLHPSGWPACLAVVVLCVLLKPLSIGYLSFSGLLLLDALILAFHIVSYQRYRNNRGRDAALYLGHVSLLLFFLFQVDLDDVTYASPIIAIPAFLLDSSREAVRQSLENGGFGLQGFLYVEIACLVALIASWIRMARPNVARGEI